MKFLMTGGRFIYEEKVVDEKSKNYRPKMRNEKTVFWEKIFESMNSINDYHI